MKDTLINSFNIAVHSINNNINIWMIIAIIELIAIVILILRLRPKETNPKILAKQKVMEEGNIDYANIINSTFKAQTLYKELIRKCHPDRFAPDETKMKIANELSSKITKYQNNYNQLKILQQEAEDKLNINF